MVSTVPSCRTVQSGNWNDVSVWEQSFDRTTWTAASAVPDETVQDITIRTGYTVTVEGSLILPDTTVESGAVLTVSAAGSLSVDYATALTVHGSFTGSGTIANSIDSIVAFAGADQTVPGGVYGTIEFSGSGTKTLAGTINVNGDLTIASGVTLDVSDGNWTNNGTFTAQNGTVTLDGTDQVLTGSTVFYNLTKTVTSADTLTFAAGSTATVTGTLTLEGADGEPLSLRSSSDGTQWKVDPHTVSLAYLDVKDSNNISDTGLDAADCTDSGNNTGWAFSY